MKLYALIFSLMFVGFSTYCTANNGSFKFLNIDVSVNGDLSFKTQNETSNLGYSIEQYVYNKWQVVKEIAPLGMIDTNSYTINVSNYFNSGKNTFRVKQESVGYLSVYSKEVSVVSDLEKVFEFKKGNSVILSKRVNYFITNENGFKIAEGFGSVIDVSEYSVGKYMICFDNQVAEVRKSMISF